MKPLGRLEDHYLLAKRMAQTTDVDLEQAFADGVLTHDTWSDWIQTCRGCHWAKQCDTWLSSHFHEDCAPNTCLNRARFEDLRRHQKEA